MVRGLRQLLARAAGLGSVDLPRFLAVLGGAGACAGLFLGGVYAWGILHQPAGGRVAVVTPQRTPRPKRPMATPTPTGPAPEPTAAPPSGPTPLRSPAPSGSVLADRSGGTTPGSGGAATVTTEEPEPARAPTPTPPPATPPRPALAPTTAPPTPEASPTPISIGLDLSIQLGI